VKHCVATVVLAAGLSSRMAPVNKLLAPMPDGSALITHTVRHALASKARQVIVVTGFQSPLIGAELADLPIDLVHCPKYAEGLAASLREGVAALSSEAEAVLIMLGDMPLVGPALLDQLHSAYNPPAHDIVVPVWQSRQGNPRLWGHRYFEVLQSLTGDSGANQLLNIFSDRIVEVASPNDSVLRDFDTQEAINTLPEGKFN
jgi:molybdenum cofactor cytidylyltransferase